MFKKSDIIEKGYIDEIIEPGTDLVYEIEKMRKEKNAIILAHYYQTADIQDIADYVGDSLDLSRTAADAKADIILFAGVNFMAETAKILSPGSKVLLPDLNASCSLSETCPPEDFKKFVSANAERTVITYINSSAEIKALSDIICTSTNAYKIVESLPKEEKIIFAPDRNLGNFISNKVSRDMIIWQGACHVHEEFSIEGIIELKRREQDAGIIVHPECEQPVRMVADFIGSTGDLLRYIKKDGGKKYIVGTETGIIHQMKKARPEKIFIPAPVKNKSLKCSECNFMKLITMEKIYLTLKYEEPELKMDKDLMKKAEKPIRRMLEISDRLGI
ncbi:MAG TPA: quinolinate synthase [Bacteroidales bacterium]|nr:quinolinate synthase [Bacteroidales bacterium]